MGADFKATIGLEIATGRDADQRAKIRIHWLFDEEAAGTRGAFGGGSEAGAPAQAWPMGCIIVHLHCALGNQKAQGRKGGLSEQAVINSRLRPSVS